MAEESPFGLTNENQNFDDLREEDNGLNQQVSSSNPDNSTLADDDVNSVRGVNENNRNKNNTNSSTSTSNALSTNQSSGIVGDSNYFNYRGINGKNFVDANFVDNQHIITVDKIIEYFNKYPSLKMKFTHFAYLKKLGVYPNNRLIIARRYATPTNDNMFNSTEDSAYPISTVVSWMDPKESLLEISFNEKWEDATESLMDIFKDILTNGLGLNLDPPMPLPGFTVGLQYAIMESLGITNADANNVPQGNPNLVHETKRRRVPGDDLGGSGLESDFKIKMVCEYEQKYIGRVDPTIGYLDVIGNLLMMGTSNEEFLITGSAAGELTKLYDLAKENKWGEFIDEVLNKIVEGIQGLIENVGDLLTGESAEEGEGDGDQYSTDLSGDSPKEDKIDIAGGFASALSAIEKIGTTVLAGIFSKYREKMKAAIAAMSGMPNGPWHIMMGNPKNPFFVSGDMICKKVSIEFKSELAYNDLPAEYTATLEFEPARNHGADSLGSKLNHGKGRIYGKPPTTSGENANPSQSANNVQGTQRTSNNTSN